MSIVPDVEAIQEQLSRVTASAQFVRSKRLVRFLRFVVEKALSDAGAELTEYTIGTAVYDRPADFDPIADGIVRGEAHRMRAKLKEYYRTTGRTDTVLIEYPIGSYVPSFRFLTPEFLPKTGVAADLIRMRDWSLTPLGSIVSWPRVLKSALSTHLRSQFPAAILWGPELRFLFNDALYEALGDAYRTSLGEPASKVLEARLPQIVRIAQRVLTGSENFSINNSRWMIGRESIFEERYFTTSLSPLMDSDGQPAAVLLLACETTAAVLLERRNRTLMEIGTQLVEANSAEHACQLASTALQTNPLDIPFASLYLFDPARQIARLQTTVGMQPGLAASPQVIAIHPDDSSPLSEAAMSRAPQVLQVDDNLGPLPLGPWSIPAHVLVVLPLAAPAQSESAGLVIAGVNPHRVLDKEYRHFFELMASRIGTMIAYGRMKEADRRRAEFTGGLDRERASVLMEASEGLRAPLTPLMGLLSQVIESPDLSPRDRKELSLSQGHTFRILKLVNTLVDLGRIQTGKMDAIYAPLDLSALTIELAGTLHPAIQAAGVRMTVDCQPLPETAYVDRSMWEKIVLNLLLSALQSTRGGEIGITLKPAANRIELVVWHSGAGPLQAGPLQRNADPVGESSSDTLGLTLVRHLAALQDGRFQVESEEDGGTKFTVSIPRGNSHLSSDRVVSTSSAGATAMFLRTFLEEALTLSVEKTPLEAEGETAWYRREIVPRSSRRILMFITDPGLRQYYEHLFGEVYHLETVTTGDEVLTALRQRPFDALFADAALDAPALVRRIRSDPATGSIPVILISSRGTGEEVRAFAAGADAYLVAPLTAQELLVRVESQIALSEVRRKAENRERNARESAEMQWRILETVVDRLSTAVIIAQTSTGEITLKNKKFYQMFGEVAEHLRRLDDVRDDIGFHPDGTPYKQAECPISRAARHGEVIVDEEIIYHLPNGWVVPVLTNSYPVRDSEGRHVATVLTLTETKPKGVAHKTRRAG